MSNIVYIESRINKVSSQHVRELIEKCTKAGSRIYTSPSSDLIMKECLALGIYPTVTQLRAEFNCDIHIFVRKGNTEQIEEIKVLYKPYQMTCIFHEIV